MSERAASGLVLQPFRALRPTANANRLADLLCPPYDVISSNERRQLLDKDPDNAVAIVLPDAADGADRYHAAARKLENGLHSGLYSVDPEPALYVYEMAAVGGPATRGLLGAVELRDPVDGVILPHENTMAGPVADRLALMEATGANVEPIYLVYDGGGAASELVHNADQREPVAEARTADGITHRLWTLTDRVDHAAVRADLAGRRALIADGHHRYATYRELQQRTRVHSGPGPWDFGLTLLVDSTEYGPQVHAIHRVLVTVPLPRALAQLAGKAECSAVDSAELAMSALTAVDGFAAILTDGTRFVLVQDRSGALATAASRAGEPAELAGLDVTVLHRVLVKQVWELADTVDVVGYAHDVDAAIAAAEQSGGTAVLLRPTPVAAVASVAAAGARMPRKSTLFTPKPASGLVMRRFADEH
jgi:uncharacterized protein (DUF1015 family)